MYPETIIIDEWLYEFKKHLSIADDSRDDVLLSYLEIAHKNIWTLYYQLPLDITKGEEEIPLDHPWALDTKTKMGTLHLAASYYANPDENNVGSNIIDKRMIYRILGDRVNYGKIL